MFCCGLHTQLLRACVMALGWKCRSVRFHLVARIARGRLIHHRLRARKRGGPASDFACRSHIACHMWRAILRLHHSLITS